jgi:hypothetical protein
MIENGKYKDTIDCLIHAILNKNNSLLEMVTPLLVMQSKYLADMKPQVGIRPNN